MKTVASFIFSVVAAVIAAFAAPTPTQYVRSGVADNVLQTPVVGSTTAPIYSAPVASIAALRALNVTTPALVNGASIQVSGYYAANDGGGGTYVWNSTSTAADNGGTVIQVTGVATGRWLLQYSGPIDVAGFGVKGDGTVDDEPAVSAAITAAIASTGYVKFGKNAVLKTPLAVSIGGPLIIDLQGNTVTLSGVTGNAITFSQNVGNRAVETQLRNGVIANGTSSATVTGLRCNDLLYFTISRLKFTGFSHAGAIAIDWNDVEDSSISDTDFINCDLGFYAHNQTNNIECRAIWFQSCLTSAVKIDSANMVAFRSCLFQGNKGTHTIDVLNTYGLVVQDCWFEGNGDGTSNTREIYAHPTSPDGVTSCRFEGNDFANTVTGGVPFGFTGTGETRFNAFVYNIYSSDGSGTIPSSSLQLESTGIGIFGTGIKGTASNNNAPTGFLGEWVEASLQYANRISLTTVTPANVTSITLTPGDWDVSGVFGMEFTGATDSYSQAGISSTSATIGNLGTFVSFTDNYSGFSGQQTRNTPVARISIAVTTTIYLVANCSFSVGTVTAWGEIHARRVNPSFNQ